MNPLITTAIIISLITIAIHICFTWKGMIFYTIGKWLQLRLHKYIKKPLFDCPMCMSSFWTIVFFVSFFGFIGWTTFVVMLMVCGINTVLNTFIYAYHEEPDDIEPITHRWDYNASKKDLEKILYGEGCVKNVLSPEQLDHAVKLQKALHDFEILELKEKFSK